MPITDPQAVRFCNENARVMADALEKFDRTATQFMLNVVRDWEDRPEVRAAADGDIVVDGSARDGRSPVTKLSVGQLKYVVEQIRACIATDDRRQLTHNWVTNSNPLF